MKKKNKVDTLIDLAIKSLVLEVSLYPKPGLVDPIDAGSHTDMNYFTFIDSCFALRPGFLNYYKTGLNHKGSPSELFDKIRLVGMDNENNMFEATNNVNTHKGANFLYGVVIAAIAYKNYPKLRDLQKLIKEMTKGLVFRELESLQDFKSHGEKVYQKYEIAGIRDEVEKGIPHAFDIALPLISEINDLNLKKALLALISSNDDSNIIKRGGIEGLVFAKDLANKININTDETEINKHLLHMNTEFKNLNLSPGGSADLLALSIFLKMYEFEIKRFSKL